MRHGLPARRIAHSTPGSGSFTITPLPLRSGVRTLTEPFLTPDGSPNARIRAFDYLRGFVMILMLLDHANGAFNGNKAMTDAVYMYPPDAALSLGPYLVRWITHLCAPAFVFLAGASLAISNHRRQLRGASASSIDRDMLIRGIIIILVDVLYFSWLFEPGFMLLMVMYAIGGSMILMIPARRLPSWVLVALALAILVGGELLFPKNPHFGSPDGLFAPNTLGNVLSKALLTSGFISPNFNADPPTAIMVGYPLLPWWSVMALGVVLGRAAVKPKANLEWIGGGCALCGFAGLMAFVIVRGINAYGNMQLYRRDGSLLQWLHVSKYPPSLTFIGLELGLVLMILAGLLIAECRRPPAPPRGPARNPITVFGQTAFFFYVVHLALVEGAARVVGLHSSGDLQDVFIATALGAIVLYPVCLAYRKLKTQHPRSVLRYF